MIDKDYYNQEILSRMVTIAYSNSPDESEELLAMGYDLIMTFKLTDMTDPSRTIYIVTGAGYLEDKIEAYKHGYLDNNGEPMELHSHRGKYPIAINSALYNKNFDDRLDFLYEHTKWPFGIHVGGSRELMEHSYPDGLSHARSYWTYGFLKTHSYDEDIPLSQYQVEVWEDVTNELIERAYTKFKNLKLATTAFSYPRQQPTKRTLTSLTSGSELWYMLKRFRSIHKSWLNIFSNTFMDTTNKPSPIDKFTDIAAQITSYDLRRHICYHVRNSEEMHGIQHKGNCVDLVPRGADHLATLANMHGGVFVSDPFKLDKKATRRVLAIKRKIV